MSWIPQWFSTVRSLRTMIRPARWELEPKSWPPNSGVTLPHEVSIAPLRVLLEAGVLLTNAKSALHPPAWFAVFRYCEALVRDGDELRLHEGVESSDPRLAALLSEEVGVGISGCIARDLLDVVHITDVWPLLDSGSLSYVSPPVDPKHPKVRPDYLCIQRNGQTILIESKGAKGTRCSLRTPLNEGKIQVRNIDLRGYPPRVIGGVPCLDRLVIGTHFCVAGKNPRSTTTTVVYDPPSAEGPATTEGEGVVPAVRQSYAKALYFAGATYLADLLVEGRAWPESAREPGTIALDRLPFIPLGPFPLGGAVCVFAPVWEALVTHSEEGFLERLRRALTEVPLVPNGVGNERGLIMSNGIALVLP